jgi:MFS family permease
MSQANLPPAIRRNILLLFAAQVLTGIGFQLIPLLGGLMAVVLTGSPGLSGAAVTLTGVGQLVAAYPAGRLMDRIGRRGGLGSGAVMAAMGAVGAAFSLKTSSLPLAAISLLAYGMGFGALRQMHIAAADLFPPRRRGEGIGLLTMGGVVGSFAASGIVAATRPLSASELSHYTILWFVAAIVLLIVLLLLASVRPDPLEVARNPRRYYPSEEDLIASAGREESGRPPRSLLGLPSVQVALLISAVVHGNMVMGMALAPVVMRGHGHDLGVISLAVAIHVLGMYGLAAPIGRLGDRHGRLQLLAYGLVISAGSMIPLTLSSEFSLNTAGMFGIGLGWSFGAISTAALLSDLAGATYRGAALGMHEISMRVGGLLLPLAGGWITSLWGYPAIGYFGLVIGLLPLLFLPRMRAPTLHSETSSAPGR